MCVSHEVDERTLEAGASATQHDETAGCKLRAALEIDDAQLRAEIPMCLGLEIPLAGRAPATHFRVVVLVIAHRSGVGRHVGRMEQQVLQLRVDFLTFVACTDELVFDLGHARLRSVGFVTLAVLHEHADLLRQRVALGLERLFLHDGSAACLVELRELLAIPIGVAVAHRFGNCFLIIADELYIKHGCSSFVFLPK